MPQSQSALLRLPTELRLQIYSYLLPNDIHVRLRNGTLLASACIQGGAPFRGDVSSYDIEYTDETWQVRVPTSVYARRLQSTWGLHWSCEEHTSLSHFLLTECTDIPDLLNIFPGLRNEVYDFLARTSTIHVSDLDLINYWARASEVTMPVASEFAKMPVSNVSRLSITLKLPLAFFQSADGLSGNYPTSSDIGPATQPARLWQDLGSILSRFEALKKLDLWLDHNEPQFWVVANERSTLDPLLTQLSTRPNLDITVTLPMLHPKFEQSERHYTEDSISGNIRVNRVLRSKKHAVIGAQGCIEIIACNDFPLFSETYQATNMGLSALVGREREQWKQGRDVEDQYRKLTRGRYSNWYP